METLYYTKNDELLPVPVRFVRETGYGAKIIESDYFYGQHSIDDSVWSEYVTENYKIALQRTIAKIEKQISTLEARKEFFLGTIETKTDAEMQSVITQKFGELRNVAKALPKELRNLDLTLSLVGFLNHLDEQGKLCADR